MSITVRVELSPVFQSLCPSPLFTIQLKEEEATVQGLCMRLSLEYGERMKDLLFEKGEGSVMPGLMVMVNDQIYTGVALSQKEVRLMEGDRVSLLYFVSGG
ncbi:MAG: MoaD/ThiS family protein [Syntrophaceae bacterium]|nr:MoaD/ThiS family protein [Syntrophaceae bacterium]